MGDCKHENRGSYENYSGKIIQYICPDCDEFVSIHTHKLLNRAEKAEQQRDELASDLETAVLRLKKAEQERDQLKKNMSELIFLSRMCLGAFDWWETECGTKMNEILRILEEAEK